jgi:hypothetical protein
VVRHILIAVVAALCVVAIAGCGGGSNDTPIARYERVWPDGLTEKLSVWTDGRVQMEHGDVLERLTLTSSDLDRIRTALASPIPTGTPDDSPRRTLTLADGTVVTAPRPEPGTVTELLDRLMSTHSLAAVANSS